ncbi:MAG: mechanosensitive ion channel family protein [Candidatus Njordarchaeales archaeon]
MQGIIENLYSLIAQYPWIIDILKLLTVLIIIIILDRYVARKSRLIAEKLELSVGTVKGIITLFRFVLVILFVLVLATTQLIPPEYFVGASALVGTAVGFGLSRFLSDYISGLYVLLSGAFKIGDYVRVDNEEGVVVDMTTSHTKIRRPDGSVIAIANSALAGKSILNYRVEENESVYYVYTIRVSYDLGKYGENAEQIIEDFAKEYREKGIDISYSMVSLTRLEAVFDITIKVKDPMEIPKLRSEILLRLLRSST